MQVFCSASGMEDQIVLWRLILISAVSQPFGWKRCQNGGKWLLFYFWLGTTGIGVRRHNTWRYCISDTELQNVREFLKILWPDEYSGPAFGVPSAKGWDFRGPLPKNETPPKYLGCFFWCSIQCRSLFFHQTWSSLVASISYGRLKVRGQNGQKSMNIP